MTEDVIGSAVGYVLQDGCRAGHGVRWAACDGESETLTDRRRTARQFAQYLKAAMNRTWAARLGYLLTRQAFRTLRDKMDPRKSNGGVFLGLNGIVIKSHGGADAEGFASAIDMGYDMFRYELLAKIGESMARDLQASATARVASGAIS
jgi:glycerol-3-phosphate acyltransferase PlsX